MADLIKTEEHETQPNNSRVKPSSAERDDISQHSKVSRSHDSAFKRIKTSGKSSDVKQSNNVTDQAAAGHAEPSHSVQP
jgi:hypothetical protein